MKRILMAVLVLLVLGCSDDDQRSTEFINGAAPPSNVMVRFGVTQDNSGLVTLTPTADGATQFEIDLGDGSETVPLLPGESVDHVYTEGTYAVGVTATSVTGKTTQITEPLVVSFLPPQNLVVTIENDQSVSKQVNVTATAELGITYEVDFGEFPDTEPLSDNIGETISYVYEETGIYTITVTAFSAGTETATYTEDFEVTAILQPLVSAPTPPNREASDVISMFSDAYEDVPVDTWNTSWSDAVFEDVEIEENPTKKYTSLNFNGIETVGEPIDAAGSGMMYFHLDVWTPNMTEFRVKLVDFGGDGFGGDNDTEGELSFTPTNGEWVGLDIPLADFEAAGMTNFSDINQLIVSGNPSGEGILFIDNVYYYKEPSGPTTEAPTPIRSNVISMFSDAYEDVPVDTWNTVWSDAMFEDVEVNGNPTKKYTSLNFNGIETVAMPINAAGAGMTHFHLDVWTPNITEFRVKLVDFNGDGFGGANGDTEAELPFTPANGEWVGIDIPLANFEAAGMTNFSDINQLIISGDPSGQGEIYIDNVYYYSLTDSPSSAAPMPTRPEANVISMFSDAYEDVPVDTWNTSWSVAMFEDVEVDGNPTKKYTSLDFNGIETVTEPIDATGAGMTHFHLDIWTPNMTEFRVKLVDFGGDGFGGSNGDTEAELSFSPIDGEWVSLDIPLADFEAAGMTNFSDINQLIISGNPAGEGEVYVDNVYYYSLSDDPSSAAPDPSLDPADVISMFSDVYMDVFVDTWNTSWSAAMFEDVEVDGNPTKQYTSLDFNGIETTTEPIDATAAGMTHFHLDVWTPNMTLFRVKLVDFRGDGFGGDNGDTEAEISFTPENRGWVSIDIPLSEFQAAGMTDFSDINQLIISGTPAGAGTVFIDNVYFHK